MSADHVSLSELSEFLDDSDGHRLAQFLQKKSGAVQPGRRRIFDCEPERFSLNVRLRRISSPPPPVIRNPPFVDVVNNCIKEGPISSEEAQGEDEVQQSEAPISKCADIKLEISNQELRDSRTSVSETSRQSEIFEEDVQLPIICEQTQRPETTSMPVGPESSPQRLLENSVQPLAAIAEQQRPCCTTPVPSFRSQPGTPHSVRPEWLRSPLAKISRSGAVRSENHLRRQVLQGLSNKGNYGRRNLLKGFENTLSSPDFAPQICSTPMHHKPAKTLETIPPRRSNVPTADQPMQTAEHNSIPDTLQPSENERMTQQDLPSIRNMIVEALEGAVKKMKSIENTLVRTEAAHESVAHSNVLPQTQELLQQAQAQISTSNPVHKSQEPNTQELLHEVQKALICIQKSQPQVPKIVIPVNQTFNNAPTPSTKQPSDKEHVSRSDGLHRTHETENEQTLVNTMIRNNSPAKCHGTFMRSNTINYKVPTDSVRDNNIITNNSHSHESRWQTFTKPTTHTEKVVGSALREPCRNECRSPLRPINQEAYTDNNRTQNECRNSVQPVNQIITSTSSNQTLTQARTESKKVHELIENQCANSVAENESPLPPARCKSLNNELLVTEPTTHRNFGDKSNLARKTAELSTTEVANSPLITEDEDEDEGDNIYLMNKKRVLRKSGPLNLATEKHQPAVHSRRTTKRTLPSRPTARPLITSNTQTDPGPPPAHPLNLHHSKRGQSTTRKQPKRPLNKPPNTPKNGEKFAEELKAQLKRLTNLEILDLRKRNSLGHTLIRPTPLQKSTVDMKQALQEKLQIEECIQNEILRRDLLGESHGLHDEVEENENGVECEIGDDLIFNELPSAPDVFKDNAITNVTRSKSTLSQLIRRSRHSSSLVGDNSTERVSFLSPTTINYNTTQDKKCRNRKKKAEQLPEITQKYLEIHKKSKKRKSNISKRSLYSKGDSEAEYTEPAVNVPPVRENCPSSTIEPLSSPPTVSKICSLHIPSPPPPFHISPTPSRAPSPNLPPVVSPIPPPPSFAVSTAPMDECISPPAPFLYNCSDNNRSGKSTGSSVAKTATQVACQTDDDALFKRPTVPVPRVLPKAKAKGAKKARTNVTASNDAIATETQPSDKVELRRSKRGQVPIKTNNFLISLYKQVRNRRDRDNEKHKMSRYLSSDACNEMSMPAACSTVNNTKAKAGGCSNRKKKATRTFSYLGETNTTSDTVLTRISRIENSSANQLQAIAEARMESDSEIVAEAPMESDSEIVAEANAVYSPATTDSETFPTNTQTKKTKAPTKKRGRAKEKRNNANAVSSPATTDSETFPTNPPTKETKKPKKKRGTLKGKRNNSNQKQNQTDAVADFELQVQENTATATAATAGAPADVSMELPRNSRPENVMETENRIGVLECSRVSLPIPPPLDKLNEMFDQLKNAANNSREHTSPTPTSTSDSSSNVTRSSRTRRLRVRLRRLRDNTTSATTSNAPTPEPASSSTQVESARDELSAWLKNVGYLRSATDTDGLFMDMRTSTAGNLFFTELDGIDYAFYDTQSSNIGYLRFKPLQSKPLKRTKKYPLQFVVFSGLFSFSTDRDHATLRMGDMVSINIGCRYKIDNLEEDIGIIMVFRQ